MGFKQHQIGHLDKKSTFSLYNQVHLLFVQVTKLMLLESHFKRYVSFMSIKINWPCLLTHLPPWLGGGVLSDLTIKGPPLL